MLLAFNIIQYNYITLRTLHNLVFFKISLFKAVFLLILNFKIAHYSKLSTFFLLINILITTLAI